MRIVSYNVKDRQNTQNPVTWCAIYVASQFLGQPQYYSKGGMRLL